MKYKLVIFDWDGTVMDSVARIISCVKTAQHRGQLPPSSDQQIKNIIGLSLDAAMLALYPTLDEQQLKDMVDAYREEYVENDSTPTPIFDQLESVLIALKQRDIKIAVATGKGRGGLERVIEVSGLGHYFCDTVCASDAKSKPDPQMIDILLSRLNIKREDALMIGDSTLDMAMARSAGIDAVGVTYGVHTREELAAHQPVAIVDNAGALLEYVF